jgi:drug/metabolite transporter (DMT)-like permease
VQRGIIYGLASAALFGLSTPLAKSLLGSVHPLLLAGLLYAGSGLGLSIVLGVRGLMPRTRVAIGLPSGVEWWWLAAAIVFGGIAGPVALMYGLLTTPASSASLLLNLEAVFTALLAWFLFRENFDRRIALGMAAIVTGGLVLAWSPDHDKGGSGGSLLIATACFCWALDNNLTRRASAADAVAIAALKGVVAGVGNVSLALLLGQHLPSPATSTTAMIVGLSGYGVSLVLFVLALRDLGSARTGAYFSVAPFFGAAAAVALQGDAVSVQLLVAGVLMAIGVWLHVTEHHEHVHAHEAQEHTHPHLHDEHHRHSHPFAWDGREPHVHTHVHEKLVHAHRHYPDVHHRHAHQDSVADNADSNGSNGCP